MGFGLGDAYLFEVMKFVGNVFSYFGKVVFVDGYFCKHNYSSIMIEKRNQRIFDHFNIRIINFIRIKFMSPLVKST